MDALMNRMETASMRDALNTANSMLEQLSTAVLLLDEQLRVLYANSSAEQMLATSRTHLVGQSIALFHWQEETILEAIKSALVDKRSFTGREVRLYLPYNGQIVTLDYTATPSAQGTELLLELISQDRSLRLSREDNLYTTNQATQALVLGMAHEVRNPLGGIRGAARSEEHTSELQSRPHLVCRLLLEKKKKK